MTRHTAALLTLSFTLGLAASGSLALAGGTKGLYRDSGRVPVRALAVGVSNFEALGPDNALPSAERDALWFIDALDRQIGVEESTVLTGRNATSSVVKDEVHSVLSTAGPNEAVVLYLSTHGALQNNRAFLLTRDSDDTRLASTSLPLSQLKRWIEESPADQVVLFSDTAHGELKGAHGVSSGPEASIMSHISALGDARLGVLALSTEGAMPELPIPGCGEHGLFACALVRGLEGAADLDQDAQVSFKELALSLPDVLAEVSEGAVRSQAGGRFDESLTAGAIASPQADPAGALPQRYASVTHPDVEVCLYQNNRPVPAHQTFYNGDQFDLSLSVPEGGYLHLVNVDPTGQAEYLFPQPGEDNFVSAGATTRVLPADTQNKVYLSDPVGTEHVYIVWTREDVGQRESIMELAKAHARGDVVADAQWMQAARTRALTRLPASEPTAALNVTPNCSSHTPEGGENAWVLNFTLTHAQR